MGETHHQNVINNCVEICASEVVSIRIFESCNMINLYYHIQAMEQKWVLSYKKTCIGFDGE